MKVTIPQSSRANGESTAHRMERRNAVHDELGVFQVVDEKECCDNGCKPLMLKWVDKMKGEKCFSRLVCLEIKRAKARDEQLGPEDAFSPMPPSEGLKMLVSTMMSGHDDGNQVDGPFEMATWDVCRAHFCGEARRWMYTYLLEGHEQVGKLARLCRSMERNAASIWGDTWLDVLKEFHEGRNGVHRFLAMEISKDCVMVTWLHEDPDSNNQNRCAE